MSCVRSFSRNLRRRSHSFVAVWSSFDVTILPSAGVCCPNSAFFCSAVLSWVCRFLPCCRPTLDEPAAAPAVGLYCNYLRMSNDLLSSLYSYRGKMEPFSATGLWFQFPMKGNKCGEWGITWDWLLFQFHSRAPFGDNVYTKWNRDYFSPWSPSNIKSIKIFRSM